MKARTLLLTAVLIVLIVLAGARPSAAQKAGDLDTSFGNNGTVTIDFGAIDVATAAAVDSQGRIVVVGFSYFGGFGNHWALARYLKNGQPDPTFGTGGNGRVLTSIPVVASAVALDSLGRIVVTGQTDNGSGLSAFCVALQHRRKPRHYLWQ